MHKMTLRDRDRALEYLAAEPVYNFFQDFDIRNYGFDSDFQDVWCLSPEGDPGALLLRYFSCYIIYSRDERYDAAQVAQMLEDNAVHTVIGKASVVDRLAEFWPLHDKNGDEIKLALRHDLLSTLTEIPDAADAQGVFRAGPEHVDGILNLHFKISEFDARQNPEPAREIIRNAIITGGGRYLCIAENGEIVAVAGSAAETSTCAAIGGVATAPEARRRGYSTKVVSALCRQLLAEGRKFCVLFYDNPDAGRIYNRLGFSVVGMWAALNIG